MVAQMLLCFLSVLWTRRSNRLITFTLPLSSAAARYSSLSSSATWFTSSSLNRNVRRGESSCFMSIAMTRTPAAIYIRSARRREHTIEVMSSSPSTVTLCNRDHSAGTASPVFDSGVLDPGTPDSVTLDPRAPDSGVLDLGMPDAGVPDSDTPDPATPHRQSSPCSPPVTIWPHRCRGDTQRRLRVTRVARTPSRLTHTGSRLTHTGSQLTRTGSQLTHTGSRLTHTGSQLTHTGSQLTRTGSQLTHTGSQLTHTGSQLTRTGSRLTHTGSQLTHTGITKSHTNQSTYYKYQSTIKAYTNKAIRDGKYLAPPHASAWQRSPH